MAPSANARGRGGPAVRRGIRLIAAAALFGGLMLLPPPSLHAQSSTPGPPPFSGSAAAGGVRVTLTVPGAPATDTPLDGGGPTAQVSVDSIGTSTGYAAFPDPGQFAVSIPGLVVGLLAGGAGGLPPIKLPSPPNYPFFVQSDAANAPEQQVGSGPLALSASSQSGSSKAQATTGFQTGLAGNAALVSSLAQLAPSTSGSANEITAKATSDLQGLSLGPLTIGEVKSLAVETLDSTGTVTPSTDLSIAGLRVGGVPVELAPQGFVAGGPTYPVPLSETLNSLLKPSGISLQFVAAQRFTDRVIAPALQVTFPFAMPFAVPNVGKFSGTATVIIGSATAQMSGATTEGMSGAEATSGGTGAESTAPANELATPGTASVPGATGSESPTLGGNSATAPSVAVGSSPQSVGPGRIRPATLTGAQEIDTRSLYLLVVVGVIVAVAAGQLIRRLGGAST